MIFILGILDNKQSDSEYIDSASGTHSSCTGCRIQDISASADATDLASSHARHQQREDSNSEGKQSV